MTSSTLALSMPFPVKVDQFEGGASMSRPLQGDQGRLPAQLAVPVPAVVLRLEGPMGRP